MFILGRTPSFSKPLRNIHTSRLVIFTNAKLPERFHARCQPLLYQEQRQLQRSSPVDWCPRCADSNLGTRPIGPSTRASKANDRLFKRDTDSLILKLTDITHEK